MASTVLVKDVLWRVAAHLQDYTPQYARWPEQELVNYLNDAQAAIAKFLPAAASRVDTIRLQAGSRQSIETIATTDCKPGDGSTPAVPIQGQMLLDIVRNMGTDGVTPGKVVRLTERKVLDETFPLWHLSTGAAVAGFMYDPRTPKYFYVTPALSARAWVEAMYAALPVLVPAGGVPGSEIYANAGSSAAKLTIGDESLDDVVNYVVARANLNETEWADGNKAAAFTSLFLTSLNARVVALTGNNPGLSMLPFAPEPLGRAKA